jgi:hypothetical protein
MLGIETFANVPTILSGQQLEHVATTTPDLRKVFGPSLAGRPVAGG